MTRSFQYTEFSIVHSFLCHSMLCWVFDDLVVNKKDMLKTKDVASLLLQTFK